MQARACARLLLTRPPRPSPPNYTPGELRCLAGNGYAKKYKVKGYMKNKILLALLLTLLGIPLTRGLSFAQDEFDQANSMVQRLSPNDFDQLPTNIKKDLLKRRCTIPQSFNSTIPHNVIIGSFLRKGQKDWAVLCSSGQVSSILIYPNEATKNVYTIASLPDKHYLMKIGDKIVYARGIESVNAGYIVRHHEAYGGPKPPPIDHEGINNMLGDTASSVFYYHRGKWLRLTGAD
jgi:hypothetical protein